MGARANYICCFMVASSGLIMKRWVCSDRRLRWSQKTASTVLNVVAHTDEQSPLWECRTHRSFSKADLGVVGHLLRKEQIASASAFRL